MVLSRKYAFPNCFPVPNAGNYGHNRRRGIKWIRFCPNSEELELEIAIAKDNYNKSYEKLRIEKWRNRIYWPIAFTLFTSYVIFHILCIDWIRVYFHDITSRQLENYDPYVFIGSSALGLLLSFVIIRDKSWPYIYLHYNRAAVEAAERAGAPLIPPPPTAEEIKRREYENAIEMARTTTFSFSDYALFAATLAVVLELAFTYAKFPSWTALILIWCTKLRLMFYGIVRFGPLMGTAMFFGATLVIVGILAIADGNFSRWFFS